MSMNGPCRTKLNFAISEAECSDPGGSAGLLIVVILLVAAATIGLSMVDPTDSSPQSETRPGDHIAAKRLKSSGWKKK